MPKKKINAKHPIVQKGKSFYLKKTFAGVGQKEIPLGNVFSVAESRAGRFITLEEEKGYEHALAIHKGKAVKGSDPDYETMAGLYEDFCKQDSKPPRRNTIDLNLARLKLTMKRAGAEKITDITKMKVNESWDTSTPTKQRTFRSAMGACKSVFKESALEYYHEKGWPIENPFKNIKPLRTKVSAYAPLSDEVRESIWRDCETELPANQAMVVLLALGAGLRRSEIEMLRPHHFTVQKENVIVRIAEEGEFIPKAGQDGNVPIPQELYEKLLKLRGETESEFFVESKSTKTGKGRILEVSNAVNKWLVKKGVPKGGKKMHNLRKDLGSVLAKSGGTFLTSKVLRNTAAVTEEYYAGIANIPTVDMEGSFRDKDPLEDVAKLYGITVEEARRRLSRVD